MAQTTINNGDSGLAARTAINANFTELYSGSMTFANSIRIGQFLSTASQAETSLYLGVGAGVTTTSTTSRRGNVAIGTGAMSSLTNGSNFYDGAYSVAVGYGAMQATTTGGYNTAVGYRAMGSMTVGIQNTAVGYFALRYFTGGGNTAIGYLALQGQSGQSTGTENTAIGRSTLNVLTTGSRNIGIGAAGALQALTTGNYNVVGGSEAFERLTTQSENTSWGHWTGVYSRGAFNSAFGAFAMGQTTTDVVGNTGSYNSVFGRYAGHWITTGSYNTFVGTNTGTGSTGTQVSYSAAFGYNARVSVDYSMTFGSPTDAERVNYGFGGESYGSGVGVLYIKNAITNASTAPVAGTIIHSRDSSDGNATLAIFSEQDVEDIGTFTPTKKIKMWYNNVEYWVQLDPV